LAEIGRPSPLLSAIAPWSSAARRHGHGGCCSSVAARRQHLRHTACTGQLIRRYLRAYLDS
jgi:hypothetical protein